MEDRRFFCHVFYFLSCEGKRIHVFHIMGTSSFLRHSVLGQCGQRGRAATPLPLAASTLFLPSLQPHLCRVLDLGWQLPWFSLWGLVLRPAPRCQVCFTAPVSTLETAANQRLNFTCLAFLRAWEPGVFKPFASIHSRMLIFLSLKGVSTLWHLVPNN